MDLNQVTVPCLDYEASVEFYKKLGLRQIVHSPPRYARFETSAGTTLSIHSVDRQHTCAETVIYFEVDDVDSAVSKLEDQGLVFDTPPTDQRWLWREATLEDPAGNRICIYHAGENRRNPPWRIDQCMP
jgi:hydroxymethylpyrimidine/phosphomethylpyrimidine kinase